MLHTQVLTPNASHMLHTPILTPDASHAIPYPGPGLQCFTHQSLFPKVHTPFPPHKRKVPTLVQVANASQADP
ncbi:hypothetical protein O181_070051 [Austropuccinia psidii MF-1]|uniref:Uncharacterized protein n=1 Tax=Austropuccinia psidii MF-1 TaxID=1389203 RepID=A0A9Q3I5C0_9BASI|nr:hypothetical protein [Austropuccinia psidii MF-1]